MDWNQVVTMIVSITTITVGSTFGFYLINSARIGRNEIHHREDMQKMDEKWERLFERMDAKLQKMDEKWERLFDRLLIKDQK